MKADLIIRMTKTAGAVARIVATIERRGFAIVGINTIGDDDGQGCSLHLRVDGGDRSEAVLVRHLDKLVDVRSAQLVGPGLAEERRGHAG